MRREHIEEALRRLVAEDAGHRCGYCLTAQDWITDPLVPDHIHPVALDGPSVRENLWLACPSSNRRKLDATHAPDPLTGRRIRLFNPRRQRWTRHFAFDGIEIRGRTATGRATVVRLQLNHQRHLRARTLWRLLGLYPPALPRARRSVS